MKKIDRLILRAFIGPFIVTFFIALFVLIMQFLWKYIDDLVGKGLDLLIIAELIFYLSASIVPLALPIAILLASIMTFGSLGEHYELVALKSAGISLLRFMLPLLVVATLLSGIAFAFANYVLPVANLKYYTMLYSVTRQRPAFNIRPGVFSNDIEGYVIRAGDKSPDGKILYDINIHDHTAQRGNVNVLLAEKGEMQVTPDNTAMVFKLYNGVQYEEPPTQGPIDKNEFIRTRFTEYEMIFDLTMFAFDKKNEKLFESNYRMMSTEQLISGVDSLKKADQEIPKSLKKNVSIYFSFLRDSTFQYDTTPIDWNPADTSFLACLYLDGPNQQRLLNSAQSSLRNIKGFAASSDGRSKSNLQHINKYMIFFHYKISLSLACLVLFLIGAPLGALIRKGGLGMPMVLAILFFTIFHILTTMGKKFAEEYVMTPAEGMWMATAILLPIGLFLLFKATNDSALLNFEGYGKGLKDWFGKVFGKKENQ
ncbi:MAG: LptF/LptG family permease [Chitinophagales bacterium]